MDRHQEISEDRGAVPRKVWVGELLSSRYPDGKRPQSWDERIAGLDVIMTVDGERLTLASDGGQSPPAPGWVLMLTEQLADSRAFRWTLYGLPANN